VEKYAKKVMLVNLGVSVWSARRLDPKATKEVAEKHNREIAIGRYNKKLLPGEARSYDDVCKWGAAIREFHYRQTMEYDQLGVRLLPAGIYMDYTTKLREMQCGFSRAVENFLADYDALKYQAKEMLNGLYNETDYPSIENLRSRFGVRLKVLPFPDADQFGVGLPEDEVLTIRASIDSQAQEAVDKAMRELWTRLYDVVSRMSERLARPDAIFRDSLVTNLREIVGLLPKLNFAEDQRLAEMCQKVADRLAIHDPDTLRHNPGTRADTARQAISIQSAMAAFMGKSSPVFGDD
jgi:hypothetical protein